MKRARKSLVRSRSRLLMAAALGGAVALGVGTAEAVQSSRPMPPKNTKKKTSKKKTSKKKTSKKKTSKKKTSKKPDPRKTPQSKRRPKKKKVPWSRRNPKRTKPKSSTAVLSDVKCTYSKKLLAVSPSSGLIALSGDGEKSPTRMGVAVFSGSGQGASYEGAKEHPTVHLHPQYGFYDMAFSPDGSALWAMYPVFLASPMYNITRIDTSDWTSTPHSHFGQPEVGLYPMIAVVNGTAGDVAVIRRGGYYRDRLRILDPANPSANEDWQFAEKPDGYSFYDLVEIEEVIGHGSQVIIVGWAKISTQPVEDQPRAVIIVGDITTRSVVQGPYVIPEIRSTIGSMGGGPMGPTAKLVARLSQNKQRLYVLSPNAGGGVRVNAIARTDLASGQTVTAEFPVRPTAGDIDEQELQDIFERGGRTLVVIDIARKNGDGGRKVVELDASLGLTSSEVGFPTGIADWDIHPTGSSQLVLSTATSGMCKLVVWTP